MDTNTMIVLAAAGIIFLIVLLEFIFRVLYNKGTNALGNARRRHKNATQGPVIERLSDLYPEIAAQLPLGDIVISLDTAKRYVESCHHKDRLCELGALPLTENWSLLDELTFLAIHSTLHLLGHDHAEPEEEKVMREKEREWMLYILESEGK